MKTPKKSPKTKTQGLSKSKKVKLSDLTPKKDTRGGSKGIQRPIYGSRDCWSDWARYSGTGQRASGEPNPAALNDWVLFETWADIVLLRATRGEITRFAKVITFRKFVLQYVRELAFCQMSLGSSNGGW